MTRIVAIECLRMSAQVFLLTLAAVSARATSFDCAKAATSVERLICETRALARMDDELAEIYEDGADREEHRLAVRAAQRAWIVRRNRCADAECVGRIYELRIAQLACDKDRGMAGSAIASLQCAYAQLRLAERERVPVEEKRNSQVISNSNNPAYAKQVLAEEHKAWLTYRQARCQLYGETEGGSDAWKNAYAGSCEVDATKERTHRLRNETKGP